MAILILKFHNGPNLQKFFVDCLRKSLAVVVCLFWLLAFSGHAQSVSPAYKLKAVFLYNFVQFVDWPPTAFVDEKKSHHHRRVRS
jgi:hypothetical protein